MIQIPAQASVFVVHESVNFRKGIDGMAAVAREVLSKEPMSGAFFVFRNRGRHMLRILFYDGWWLLALHEAAFEGEVQKLAGGRWHCAMFAAPRARASGSDLGRRPFELLVSGALEEGRVGELGPLGRHDRAAVVDGGSVALLMRPRCVPDRRGCSTGPVPDRLSAADGGPLCIGSSRAARRAR